MMKNQICKPRLFGLIDGHEWKINEEESVGDTIVRECMNCHRKQWTCGDSLVLMGWVDIKNFLQLGDKEK